MKTKAVWVEMGGKTYRVWYRTADEAEVEVVYRAHVGKGFGRWEREIRRTVRGPTATKVLAAAKEK